MKPLLVAFIILVIASCENHSADSLSSIKRDTVIVHDTVYIPNENNDDWQVGFGLTHDPAKDSIWGKPVKYYLEDKECSHIALDFYYGYFRPTDNGATDELLKYACSNNAKLRPFYRWCLAKTIQVSDGALAEHIGEPARRYVEKFPKEFFEYLDSDTSSQKYNAWVDAISYSGFYEANDFAKPAEVRKQLHAAMQKNCTGCNEKTLQRINDFALDCFRQSE